MDAWLCSRRECRKWKSKVIGQELIVGRVAGVALHTAQPASKQPVSSEQGRQQLSVCTNRGSRGLAVKVGAGTRTAWKQEQEQVELGGSRHGETLTSAASPRQAAT